MEALLCMFFCIICLATYFLPTIIAMIKKKKNTLAIFILNLFLGWAIIGWVLALVWAFTIDQEKEKK